MNYDNIEFIWFMFILNILWYLWYKYKWNEWNFWIEDKLSMNILVLFGIYWNYFKSKEIGLRVWIEF